MSHALVFLQEVAELEGWECSEYNSYSRYMRIANKSRFVDLWFSPSGSISIFYVQEQKLGRTHFQKTTGKDKRAQVVSWLKHGILINQS